MCVFKQAAVKYGLFILSRSFSLKHRPGTAVQTAEHGADSGERTPSSLLYYIAIQLLIFRSVCFTFNTFCPFLSLVIFFCHFHRLHFNSIHLCSSLSLTNIYCYKYRRATYSSWQCITISPMLHKKKKRRVVVLVCYQTTHHSTLAANHQET